MKSLFHILTIVCVALTLLLTACKPDPDKPGGRGSLRIQFENRVGAESLQLEERTYTNTFGEPYTVTQFMYYVSNFSLERRDGSIYTVPESYFLVNHADPASQVITLPDIPDGDYTAISFIIGVDSARNMSGAQTGALDPVHGMFWSWNSGYIFVRMEGTSPVSPQPYHKLQFHIGGFKGATNCIRTVSPDLDGNLVQIRAGKTPTAHYQVDLSTLFGLPNPIRFTQPETTAIHGGPNAVQVADNYFQGLFRFDHIHTVD